MTLTVGLGIFMLRGPPYLGTIRDFSNLQIVSGLDFSSEMKSESVCHSLGPGISLKNVIRSRTNYGYYLSMKVALIVLLILRLDGTTQNIDNQGPSCSPGFEEGTSFILITYLLNLRLLSLYVATYSKC